MEILLFFLIIAFIVILFGAGFAFIWYSAILLKDKDSFLTFAGILLIIIGVFFVLVATGIIASLLDIGLKN